MCDSLVTEILNYCKATCGLELGRASGPHDLLRAELSLLKCLVRLCRAAMGEWFKELGRDYRGTTVQRNGVSYRFVGHRSKTLHGLFGTVPYERAYYASGSGQGWAPLDERLGIKRGHTPGCQYFLSQFAARQAHAEGVRQFHEVFRADGGELLSEKKAFTMVQEVTEGLERQRQQEVDNYLQTAAGPELHEPIGGTVAVCIDAGKMPVRGKERVDDAGKKRYEREYRDAKVAVVAAAEWDAEEQEAQCSSKPSYVAASEHADQFFPRIEVELKRRCREGEARQLVVLADGAGWIWDRAGTLAEGVPQVWYILDFWHACEHLAEASRSVYGEGSKQAEECFQRWRTMLRGSRVGEVIEDLEQLRDGVGLSARQRHEVQGEINYLRSNQGRMDYRRYRRERLPIGSGTVESTCKNMVGARLKGSGMIWSLGGAQGMLQLCTSVKSGRFKRDYASLLSASVPQEAQPQAA